jgi:hypothetical protein
MPIWKKIIKKEETERKRGRKESYPTRGNNPKEKI